MAKMACAQCGKMMKKGGTKSKKMATGGVTLTQKGAGYAKAQTGGTNAKMNIFGMPQSNMGTSGQYGKMAKGGSTGLVKADSGMQIKPKSTKRVSPNTSGVRKIYAKGGAAQSFAPNRPVTHSCIGGMVKDKNGKCVNQRSE
jgi:hypothetical protein